LKIIDYIHNGWIEPNFSPYSSPIFFVIKTKYGGLRMVIDYRKLNGLWMVTDFRKLNGLWMVIDNRNLNKIIIKNWYTSIQIDNLLDKLARTLMFSSLDLSEDFHQIHIIEVDIICILYLKYFTRINSMLSRLSVTLQRLNYNILAIWSIKMELQYGRPFTDWKNC